MKHLNLHPLNFLPWKPKHEVPKIALLQENDLVEFDVELNCIGVVYYQHKFDVKQPKFDLQLFPYQITATTGFGTNKIHCDIREYLGAACQTVVQTNSHEDRLLASPLKAGYH